MSVTTAMLRKVDNLAGAINAADSYAKTDPEKTRFYLRHAASLAGDIRHWMHQTTEAEKRG